MKRLLVILAAAAAAAFIFLRPYTPPAATVPGGWTAAAPSAADASRAARVPHAATSRAHAEESLAYVAGEVVHPGIYAVGPEARVRDAVALAGGTRPDADLLAINLAAHVRDGDAVVVPMRGGIQPRARGSRHARRFAGLRHERASRHGSRTKHRRARRNETPPGTEVDINTADAETLASIPGIGDGLAERIVEFRRQNGAFASVDELLDVAGITEHRLDAIIPYVVAR